MRNMIAFAFGVLWMSRVAFCAEPLAIRSIAPEDVMQDSIKILRMGTNKFTVFFTYTEGGAEKMLAFEEAHRGQKTQTRICDFLAPQGHGYTPRDPTEYARWREGWLKRRTDKFFGVSAADAEAIVAGLKGEPRK
jgi:hypothetical protein